MRRPTRTWVVAPPAPAEFLTSHPELPEVVAHLLHQRGIQTNAEINTFLHPDYGTDLHDPFLFRDMVRAVDRVYAAREREERILVHGDYDADGVSGATVLLDALEGIGCTADVFIPHRERDGYGFGMPGLAYAQNVDAKLIITCDCGIANVETVGQANEAGIDVIVTDHHVFRAELPKAYAILHPKLPGETYPYTELTGGGVAFKFAQAITQRDAASERRLPEGFVKWLLDVAAISTVSDYGPLLGENRTIVTYGLIVLGKTRRIGLKALYEVARIRPEFITPTTIGFQIAPRINAAGRIDHANEALRLLRTTDAEEAKALAGKLNVTNAERQRLVEEAVTQALADVAGQKERRFLMVVRDDWLPGIVGLVATKLRDQFHRPAIALTRSGGKILGSGRSIPALHIVEALRAHADLLVAFGGHPQACGLTVKGEAELIELTKRLETYATERLTPDQLVPTLTIDRELALSDVTWELVEWLGKLGPFGIGNPTPKFLAHGLEVMDVLTMGSGQQHCRIAVKSQVSGLKSQVFKMVCFRYADICPTIRVGDVVDVVYEVDVNEWNGNKEIQMKVVDLNVKAQSSNVKSMSNGQSSI
jgi:single-stranded-DNA-specific exonuclease